MVYVGDYGDIANICACFHELLSILGNGQVYGFAVAEHEPMLAYTKWLQMRYICVVATISEAGDAVEQLLLHIYRGARFDNDEAGSGELTFSQIRALSAIESSPEPMAISQIGESIGLTTATAGRCVDRLVKLKLVTRTESPTDRRVKLVTPTSKGHEVMSRRMESKRVAVAAILANTSEKQRAQLRDSILEILVASNEETHK